MKRRNKTR